MLRAHIGHRLSYTLIRSPSSRLSSRAADDRVRRARAGMAESEAKARSPAAAMSGGQRGPRGDEDQFVSYRQIALRRDKNVLEVKLLPAITCSDAVIVCVHAALIPRNKLSPTVILLVAPTLGHPGTVAVKLGLKDVGGRYPEYRLETCHLYFSHICLGGERHHMRRMRAGGDSQRSMAAGELLVHRRSLKMLPG